VKQAVRQLRPGDEAIAEAFLAARAESSMFLRSNLRQGGLVDRGEAYQGTYIAAFDDDAIAGIVAHSWTGMVLVQAPPELAGALATEAAAASGRAVNGLSGPVEQVAAARAALGLRDAPTTTDSCEDLFSLDLARLALPAALTSGALRVRMPHLEERDRLIAWRMGHWTESLGAVAGDELERRCAEEIDRFAAAEAQFVLDDGGEAVAYAAFNAALPEIVQIGGVWTPPALRGRGYARAVVAGALQAARGRGVARAVLFTGQENEPAQRAYRAIGFTQCGQYGLVLFRE